MDTTHLWVPVSNEKVSELREMEVARMQANREMASLTDSAGERLSYLIRKDKLQEMDGVGEGDILEREKRGAMVYARRRKKDGVVHGKNRRPDILSRTWQWITGVKGKRQK